MDYIKARKKNNRLYISKMEYFLMFLFVVCCGFTNGELIPAKSYTIIAFGFFFWTSRKQCMPKFSKELILIVLTMLVVVMVHKYQFGIIDTTLLKYIPLCVAGYSLVLILGQKFPQAYLDIMYFLAVISLVCYSIMIVTGYVPHIDALKGNHSNHQGIFLWNVRNSEILGIRNCGPFWEPGAYAGYLLMVGILYFNEWELLWINQRKKVMILVLALITTFSTQGYIIAFLLILTRLIFVTTRRNLIAIFVTFSVTIAAISVLYQTVPFLREKVDAQLELNSDWESSQSLQSANRFTTTSLDLQNIGKNPLWGSTSDPYVLYQDYGVIMKHVEDVGGYGSGSGGTNYIASNGIVLYLVWLFLCYKSLGIYYGSRLKSFAILVILLMLGQAEMYNAHILYHTIPFFGLMRIHERMKTISLSNV